MTDDIVTRLRRMDANIPSVDPDKYVSPTEAADEIERLRYDLHHYKGQAETYGNALDRMNEQNSKTKVVKGADPDKVYPKGRYQGD